MVAFWLASFRAPCIVHADSLTWHTGTFQWNLSIINAINQACASAAMMSQKCKKKGLLAALIEDRCGAEVSFLLEKSRKEFLH